MNEEKILRGLNELYKITFIENLKKADRDFDLNYDFLSLGQIKSKKWMLDHLSDVFAAHNINLSMIYLMGGWYAHFAAMFFEMFDSNNKLISDYKIRSFDIDPTVAEIAETINRSYTTDGWKFKATTKDIFDIDLNEHIYDTQRRDGTLCTLTETPDLIINTSGEHIDLAEWWNQVPNGILCAIQSNNYFDGDGHINCVNSVEELIDQVPMDCVYYTGTLKLEKYDRYMIIGIK